jgi:three-Cys-motif partner protein
VLSDDNPHEDRSEPEVDEFFGESTEQSRIKTVICTNYVFTWADIISRKTRSDRIAYADVYAGPGRYIDGTKSTPLLVLERAIGHNRMRDMLVTLFNDAAPGHTESLERAVRELPGIETVRHQPIILTSEVNAELVQQLERPKVPTFAFVDPFGYKGLSLRLVNAVIKDWACECLFFFNYNRINPGISNPVVTKHMEALFGAQRLAELRIAVRDRPSAEREEVVMAAVVDAMRALGGQYVILFRFKMDDADRTSHYLIFVSKNFLGYEIMRGVMAKASSTTIEGVASFEYNRNQLLFLPDGRSVEALAESLAADLAGVTMTVEQIFEYHSPHRLYIMRNYKDALIRLEAAKRVTPSRPASARRKGTLADDVVITFPPLQRAGAKASASRSTPGRPAGVLPTSGSGRPTA